MYLARFIPDFTSIVMPLTVGVVKTECMNGQQHFSGQLDTNCDSLSPYQAS